MNNRIITHFVQLTSICTGLSYPPNYKDPVLLVLRVDNPEPGVVRDDVGVDAEDARVPVPDPGQGVGPQLLDVAGQVDGVAQHRGQIEHATQGQPGKVGTGVEPGVLAGHWN